MLIKKRPQGVTGEQHGVSNNSSKSDSNINKCAHNTGFSTSVFLPLHQPQQLYGQYTFGQVPIEFHIHNTL